MGEIQGVFHGIDRITVSRRCGLYQLSRAVVNGAATPS